MSGYEDEMAELGRKRSEDEYSAVKQRFDDRLRESVVIKRLIARVAQLEARK